MAVTKKAAKTKPLAKAKGKAAKAKREKKLAKKRDAQQKALMPKPPKGTKSPPAPKPNDFDDDKPNQGEGTGQNYGPPADADKKDVAKALSVPEERAPQPFRKRDGFPDITSESIQVRLKADYWPEDVSRFGNQIRGRKGELVNYPSDEALELIRRGIADRVDDIYAGTPDDKGNV